MVKQLNLGHPNPSLRSGQMRHSVLSLCFFQEIDAHLSLPCGVPLQPELPHPLFDLFIIFSVPYFFFFFFFFSLSVRLKHVEDFDTMIGVFSLYEPAITNSLPQ